MKKAERGKPGYINSLKKKYLIMSLIEFAVVAAIFAVGYSQTGSRLNLFTVVAILGCLPACKNLVEFIVVVPHKGIEPAKYEEIEEKRIKKAKKRGAFKEKIFYKKKAS